MMSLAHWLEVQTRVDVLRLVAPQCAFIGDVVGLWPNVAKPLVVAEVAEPLCWVARLLVNLALGEAVLNPLDAAVLLALGEKLLVAVALDIVAICSVHNSVIF